MTFATTYYLKILSLWYFLLASQGYTNVSAGVIASTTDALYRQFLKLRTLPFEDCGSRYDILYLNISSCSSIPCQMQRGSKVKVSVFFDDNGNNISFLKHRVRWVFNAVKTEAYITPDPCDGNQECISDGLEGKTYWAYIHVTNTLPMIRGSMLWQTVDQYNNEVLCFQVPVVITI